MIRGEMNPKQGIVEVRAGQHKHKLEKDIFPDVIFFMGYLYQ